VLLNPRGKIRRLRGLVSDIRTTREATSGQQGFETDARAMLAELRIELDRQREILQQLFDRETENRERLRLLRESPSYDEPFEADDPLVSVVIPTYQRYELLVERAIPSIQAQTYPNVEIVVVGDMAPEDTERRLIELDLPNLRYSNLTFRGPYPSDKQRFWQVAGIPPHNEAIQQARGMWIAHLNDDDALHPDHIATLVELARSKRAELAYGQITQFAPNGERTVLCRFPPDLAAFGLQSAIYHHGLRFIEMELADALFDQPGDWSLCRRMLRAGVRVAFVERPLVDYYPSTLWED
jgi:glycosyltransferase involved in cell wall biosynthesis